MGTSPFWGCALEVINSMLPKFEPRLNHNLLCESAAACVPANLKNLIDHH